MEKIWLKQYPEGIPAEINPDKHSSLVELFEESCTKYRDNPSFANMGGTLNFGQLDAMSRDFAAYLQEVLKLEKGDRVALMMPNLLQYPVAMFGILRAGMTVVNVNPLYTPPELKHQLNDSGAKAIVIVANFAHTLEAVLADSPIRHVLTTQLGDMLPFPKSFIVNFVVKYIKKMVKPFKIPQAIPFMKALAKGRYCTYQKPEITNDDIAYLQYTGGTTGVSKGAILTHRNMLSNVAQATEWIRPVIKEGEEIIITALPLYHIFSLTANCITFMAQGGCNVLITNPRDIPAFVKELSNWEFTAITGVNTLFNALIHNDEFKNLDFSHLRLTLGGGMAVQEAVAVDWKKVTGAPLLEAYGLTEASPAVCINPLNLKEYNHSIGLPVPSTLVSIRDEDGKVVEDGEIGELWVSGPQVMRGYWQRPDETANTLTSDGWLKTGDIAKMDENGFFFIVDRKKDMILVSGFNVFPNEVENAIALHPGVLEVAAIGVDDVKCGEVVKVFIVKADNTLSEDDVTAHCKNHLTGYKRPKQIEFRDELPKTNVGKILRRALKEEEEKK